MNETFINIFTSPMKTGARDEREFKVSKEYREFKVSKEYTLSKYNKSVEPPLRDNLIYNKAEPWAKENFESFLSSVVVWVSTSKPNKLPGVLLQFEVFTGGLLSMNNLGFTTDKERLNWVKQQLKYMANKMEHPVPEEILNKADALFWGN
jgi:hypothetical protein